MTSQEGNLAAAREFSKIKLYGDLNPLTSVDDLKNRITFTFANHEEASIGAITNPTWQSSATACLTVGSAHNLDCHDGLVAAPMAASSRSAKKYWMELHLLAEAGEDLVSEREGSLKALSIYKIFQFSIDHSETAVFRSCIALGIKVDKVIGDKTPLLLCIDADNKDLISVLIDLGVDVNLRTAVADSPLHYAVDHGKEQAVAGLLECAKNKILINSLGTDGLAPLHRAAKQNKKEMIRILAHHGADVNVKGEGGSTPLHIAAACNMCGEGRTITAI